MSLQSRSDHAEEASARTDKIHATIERFSDPTVPPHVVEIPNDVFPEYTPEQWEARLVLITAYTLGTQIYYYDNDGSSQRPVWRPVGKKCGFHGPLENYSINPPKCQIATK